MRRSGYAPVLHISMCHILTMLLIGKKKVRRPDRWSAFRRELCVVLAIIQLDVFMWHALPQVRYALTLLLVEACVECLFFIHLFEKVRSFFVRSSFDCTFDFSAISLACVSLFCTPCFSSVLLSSTKRSLFHRRCVGSPCSCITLLVLTVLLFILYCYRKGYLCNESG